MKKVLSVMLASVMLVSLFAVNVSALVISETAEKLVFEETFDMSSHAFTTGTAGTLVEGGSTEDGYALQSAITGAEINLPAKYIMEFDMMIPDAAVAHFVYINNADTATVPNVGIKLQAGTITAEKWYTVRVVVDESLMTGNCDINGQQAIILYQKAKGGTEWTKSRHTYGTDAIPANADTTLIQHRPHTSFAKTAIGESAIGFSANMVVDNVKVYNAVYDVVDGKICYTADTFSVPTYADKDNLTAVNYTVMADAPTATANSYVIATFDAKNTVKGMPLAVHISGGTSDVETSQNYIATLSVLSEDETFNKWYTYKAACTAVYGTRDMKVTLYRKLAGSNEVYTALENGVDFLWNNGGRISSGNTNVRFGYRNSDKKYAYGYSDEEGATNDFTSTKWEVANVQVLSGGAAVRGFADVAEGKLNADLTVVANNKKAAAFIATYEGDRLVSADFAELSNGEGNVELSADCSNADSAKLFIWENLSVSPIVEVIDLTSNL